MMSCRFFLLCFFFFTAPILKGQTFVTHFSADSTSSISADSRLDALIKRQTDSNRLKQTINGFRVQIYFGVNRPKAAEIKMEFAQKFPDMSSYLTYAQPYYKVRIGDFRTRLQATKFMQQIQQSYSTCFIVPDEVNRFKKD